MKRIYKNEYKTGGMKTASDPEKNAIMSFFASVPPIAVAAGRFTDIVTGETMADVDNMGYICGPYSWSTCDVYHFEHYDLELSPEFREFALAQ